MHWWSEPPAGCPLCIHAGIGQRHWFQRRSQQSRLTVPSGLMQLGMRKSIGMCVSWLALRKSPRSCSLVIESGITPVRLQCLHPKTCRFGRRSPMAVGMGPVNRFTHSQIAVRPRGRPQKLAGMSCGVNEFSRMPIPFRCVSSGTSGTMPLPHDPTCSQSDRHAHGRRRRSLDAPEVVAREAQRTTAKWIIRSTFYCPMCRPVHGLFLLVEVV